jgi:hexosaminidase
MLMSRFFAALLCLSAGTMAAKANITDNAAAELGLIPIPVEVKKTDGQFELNRQTQIILDDNIANDQTRFIAAYLVDKLNTPTGLQIKTGAGQAAAGNAIYLSIPKTSNPALGKEGYTLKVTPQGVHIQANAQAGLFYGVQTLLQLLPPQVESGSPGENQTWTLPCVEIMDYPRFGWRGLMLDVSRHFFTKDEVKQFIDLMARYKFNTFQWHLTDDQGWRIEIKSYPKLTEVGAWRVPREGLWWHFEPPLPGEEPTYGGYYTQDDIREVIAYAAARFVTIVPEIDVPGHFMAGLAAYPELACTDGPFYVNPGSKFYGDIQNTVCIAKEKVYEFLDGVFGEVAALFPGQYIHMGGDEAHKGFWAKCPLCQARKEKEGLKDEEELQSYFVKRVEKIIESKGKRLIGWDEILEGGLAPNATVMSWRGIKGGVEAAKMGHHIVMSPSPFYYLDLYQGDTRIEPATYGMSRLTGSYAFEPVPEGIDPSLILGVQGNLWAESIARFRHGQYMTWPRAFAIAETGWSPKEKKDFPAFVRRVETHFARFDAADVKYAPSMYDVVFDPALKDDQLLITLSTEVPGLAIYYTFDGSNPDHHYPKYEQPLTVPKNAAELRVITYRDGKPLGRQINMPIRELNRRAAE